MFTGLVESVGRIQKRDALEDGVRFFVESDLLEDEVDTTGNSVAVSGVCLTVTGTEDGGFWVDVSDESLEKTTLSDASPGDLVNLETSLRMGEEIGGHFVFGHVDTTVPVETFEERGDFHQLDVSIPDEYRPFIARKGSIALDGISLTVNSVREGLAGVRIIPHTYRETRLREVNVGDRMNLEVDMLARYVYNNTQYLHHDSDDRLPDEPSGPDDPTPST